MRPGSRPTCWTTSCSTGFGSFDGQLSAIERPVADIDTSNVSQLAVAWEWSTREKALQQFGTGSLQRNQAVDHDVAAMGQPQ